jgi:hypothetical protein
MTKILTTSHVWTKLDTDRRGEISRRNLLTGFAGDTAISVGYNTAIDLPISVIWRGFAKIVAAEVFNTHLELLCMKRFVEESLNEEGYGGSATS